MITTSSSNVSSILQQKFDLICQDSFTRKQLRYFIISIEDPSSPWVSDEHDALFIYSFDNNPCVSLAGMNAPSFRVEVFSLAHKYGCKFRCLASSGFRWQEQVISQSIKGGLITKIPFIAPDYS